MNSFRLVELMQIIFPPQKKTVISQGIGNRCGRVRQEVNVRQDIYARDHNPVLSDHITSDKLLRNKSVI